MKENSNLEYKQDITNSFLKSVSAFSNYGGGQIIFGIDDDGKVVGTKIDDKELLKIENKINTMIEPNPDYKIEINKNNSTIHIMVEDGPFKPYYYNSKVYKRNDTSTIEVDKIELNRLILEGSNQSFEELPSSKKELHFNELASLLNIHMDIDEVSIDVLKTLELYNYKKGYNKAAELIADSNTMSGIDIVRFGDTIDIIKDRETMTGLSIITLFNNTMDLFNKYYTYEKIEGSTRKKFELIPEKSFREALANALVHRTWDVQVHIQVSMHDDRIEIVSPGGLPGGLKKEHYLNGMISILRNPIIGNLFFRFNYIEKFGTGIKRIKNAYKDSSVSPKFDVDDQFLKITLPLLQTDVNLTPDQELIYSLLSKVKLSIGDITKKTNFGKSKVLIILNELLEMNYIHKNGIGRGTKYYK